MYENNGTMYKSESLLIIYLVVCQLSIIDQVDPNEMRLFVADIVYKFMHIILTEYSEYSAI